MSVPSRSTSRQSQTLGYKYVELPQPDIPEVVQVEIARINPKFTYLIEKDGGLLLCLVNANPIDVFKRGLLDEEIIGSFIIKEGVATLPFHSNPDYMK